MDNNIIDKRTKGDLKISDTLSDKNRISILSTGKDQRLVAEVVRGENGIGEANAAFIVKACNSHESLLQSNKELLEALKENHSQVLKTYFRIELNCKDEELLKDLRSIMATTLLVTNKY